MSGRPCNALVCEPLSSCFNPRPRVSGRPITADDLRDHRQFQSTPACERATEYGYTQRTLRRFQSTPACERATAGTWPAMPLYAGFNPRPRVSGRRCKRGSSSSSPGCFNPRPRVSGRRSSHAKGFAWTRFNPRPRVSGRPAATGTGAVSTPFQSTPACERAT